jgi:acyl-CoA synthetase (AMP-forming)/AMP-acid ligase II/acetyltransferase-like isoleucine patch superfamily enzyme/acyl carrier protein
MGTESTTMASNHANSGPADAVGALTLYALLQRQAAWIPDAVAIAAPGRPPLSYRSLLHLVDETARTLQGWGLKRNDRVVVVMPNGPEMAVSFLAVAAGATCAPLNPGYRAAEFEFYISDLRPKALLVWSDLESPARKVAQALGVAVIELRPRRGGPAGAFDLVADVGEAGDDRRFALSGDTALVLHTSGTTSRPKLVPLTQANICSSAHNIASTLQLTSEDHCLNVMPLFHIHGLIAALLASLAAGSRVTCTPGFDADRFFEWLARCGPTWYTAVPTMHQALLSRASSYRDIIARHPLRFIRSSSASLPPRVMEDVERTFATQVIEAYGMTEASHQMASNPLAPRPRKPGSVGVAAGATLAIIDAAGQMLPARATGEVVIRGPGVTAGYESNATANEAAFVDGWFRTGDQGYLDEEGYLFLTGRLKEIISRGGEKIAPKELDEILGQHPAVAQAVAFAVPHPTLGEDVAAAVVLKEGRTVPERELREFLAARLADFKIPQQLVFLPEIPKGPTGKVQRVGLAVELADHLRSRREQGFESPKTPAEVELASVWQKLLAVDRVGIRDSFYVLGGDSLAMAAMLIEVEERFQKEIPLEQFLIAPTIETIATLLETTASAPAEKSAKTLETRPIRDTLFRGFKNRLLQSLALYAPGYKSTRVWLHRMRGVSIGKNVSIGLSALIETAYPELVLIGDNVTIGMRAIIIAHLRDSTNQSRLSHRYTIRIGDDVYIGPGAIILPNVTVGPGAVVSAGSVVSRSVPPKTLVRGNPAEPIAHCGVSLAGGVAYKDFVKHLRPLERTASSAPRRNDVFH